MYDLLYTNGDSFTMGMEILGDKDITEENKNHAYPMHVTDLMGIKDHANSALPGAPNEWIARQTIFDLLRYEKNGQDLSKVFCLVGWSSINRLEVSVKEDIQKAKDLGLWPPMGFTSYEIDLFGTNFINSSIEKFILDKDGKNIFDFSKGAHEFAVEYLWDEELEHEKWFTNIQLVKNFFENKGINYLMVNNVSPWVSNSKWRLNKHEDLLFDKHYYEPTKFSFQDWGHSRYPFERRQESHFTRKVHVNFAEKILYPYIKENLL